VRFRALSTPAIALLSTAAAAQPVLFPGNGHRYELIVGQTTWANAQAAAPTYSFQGIPGHLVTITTSAENSFISNTFASGQSAYFAWIGGYEPNDDGVWRWGAGPESGVQFANGATPTPPFNYVNWGGVEPNDFAPGEDFAAINLGATFAGVSPGRWIDSPNPNPSDPIQAYVVEYETPQVPAVGAPHTALLIAATLAVAARALARPARRTTG
jgi:hypothetical protein